MSTTRKPIIIVYSDDASVRAAIKAALGKRVSDDLPEHQIEEFATGPALRAFVDRKSVSGELRADLFILDGEAVPALRAFVDRKSVSGQLRADLFILDGEAVPEGGMGIARQLKDEVFNCPPVLLITGRREDAWLAAWSRAEASVIHPIDPFTLANTVADLMRSNTAAAIG
jgi:hypothetical protein